MGNLMCKCFMRRDHEETVAVPSKRKDKDTGAIQKKKNDNGNKHKKEHRNSHKREKRTKRKRHLSTSDETSTSSSDEDRKQRNRSRNSDGTTIISNTTVINGSQTNIGNNAGSVTINFLHDKKKKENKRTKKGIFQSTFSPSAANDEAKRQHETIWGTNTENPSQFGNFIDTRDAQIITVSHVKGCADASEAVCQICFPGGSGTGFRVGTRPLIMTAWHVVQRILETRLVPVSEHDPDPYKALEERTVYARFRFFDENTQPSDSDKFFFLPHVLFWDESVDTAILELNDPGKSAPFSRFYFNIPNFQEGFTLIGHSQGKPMEINTVKNFINPSDQQTINDIDFVKEESRRLDPRLQFELPCYSMLRNADRYLFNCKFTSGASGSPGVVVLADRRVVVLTMLLRGYPAWFYDRNVDKQLKARWPKEYCIEQGVNMSSLYQIMNTKDPVLCREIFMEPLPIPNL